MKANVVVLGKNYSTPLGVARSLAKADYRVEVLYIATHAGDSKIVASCKYIDRLVEIVGRHDQEVIDALTERFAEEGQKKVLFPTDDYTASLIDRYSNVLQDRFLLPHVVSGTVTQSMDKSVQSVLAKKAGLHTATEWVVSLDTDDIAIPEGIVFPCFVKPMVSAMGGKSELEKCESLQALQNKLVKMRTRQRDRSVLIQEFLNIRQEYTIGGVCNDQEIVLPAIIKKSVVARHNRGVTLQGTIVENDELSEYLSTIIGFLKSVRFVGMFDMEVLMTDKGLYFGELNLRAGGPSYSYFHSGVNLRRQPRNGAESVDSRETFFEQ